MDFIDEVRTRSGRFATRVNHLDTEEATKSALVLPFVQMLGYDIFDPTEVVPEFTADVGTKKGEKVDYALMQDGKPAILIEAKKHGSNLDEEEISQLLRYFTVTNARFGILTDGVTYRFFSDLEEPNVMDPRPFFEFDMLDFTDAQVAELKRFTKSTFDMSEAVDAAKDLKYTTEIKRVLSEEFSSPSEDFVRFIIRQIYKGVATSGVREMFKTLTHQAITEFINERIDSRLKSALAQGGEHTATPESDQTTEQGDDKAEFAPAEIESLQIVKAIVRDMVSVQRVSLRRYTRHCSILLDDNRRKAICWIRLAAERMWFGLPDDNTNVQLETLDDLYDHAEGMRARLSEILSPSEQANDVKEREEENTTSDI